MVGVILDEVDFIGDGLSLQKKTDIKRKAESGRFGAAGGAIFGGV